jgi:hypothetical protein
VNSEAEQRTIEQNRKFHAMCGDLAKQKIEWAGQTLDREQWKRLFLGAAHGQLVIPNPFKQGDFIVVNKRTSSKLPVTDMADLITQIEVFGIERNVRWSDESE